MIKNSLSSKFLMPFILVGIVMALLGSWVIYESTIKQIRDQLMNHGRVLGSTINEAMLIAESDIDIRFAIENIVRNEPGVYGITVATKNPFIIWASSFQSKNDLDKLTQDMLRVLLKTIEHGTFGSYCEADGDLVMLLPLMYRGSDYSFRDIPVDKSSLYEGVRSAKSNSSQKADMQQYVKFDRGSVMKIPVSKYRGAIYLRFDWEDIRHAMTTILLRSISILLGGISLMILLAYIIFYQTVLKPMDMIDTTMRHLEQGDLNARVPALTHDEIGNLAQTLNHMLDSLIERDLLFKTVVDNLPVAIDLKDTKGRYKLINKRFEEWFDLNYTKIRNKVSGGGLKEIHDISETNPIEELMVLEADSFITREEERLGPDGISRFFVATRFPIVDMKGNVTAIGTARTDITERKQAEDKLRLSAIVFENTNEGVIITDADAHIIAVNRAFTKITGYTTEEILDKNPRVLKSGRHEQTFYRAMWISIQEEGQWEGEIWNRRKNGEVYPQWLNISIVKNDQGSITNYVAVFSDISTLKESEERLKYLAYRDPLTNLPNRLLFNDRLNQALQHAKRKGSKVALMYIDLDNFKTINDSFGHPFGDRLLQSVAKSLSICVRGEDTIARLGGDEFAVIVEEISIPRDTVVVAQRILNELSKPITIDGEALFNSASIGISLYPDNGKDVHTLLKNADTAMYHAKESGRNTYQFYTLEMTTFTEKRMMLENAMRYAIQRGEFVLHYQPKVAIDISHIVGVEALIRWQHPEKRLIYPAEFIPLAEETGLINSIGEWVLYAACSQARIWQSMGFTYIRIAVNLSACQFRQKDLVKKITQILKDTHLAPQFLEIEITEGTLLENVEEAIDILKKLTAMGIQFAIDDFGTGYSSLNYLKRFPINRLKIDQSFVKNIPYDTDDMAITNAIIAMAHSLDIKVIAEGVETEQQMDFLRSQHCDEVQGYIFSPPVSAEEFTVMLQKNWCCL